MKKKKGEKEKNANKGLVPSFEKMILHQWETGTGRYAGRPKYPIPKEISTIMEKTGGTEAYFEEHKEEERQERTAGKQKDKEKENKQEKDKVEKEEKDKEAQSRILIDGPIDLPKEEPEISPLKPKKKGKPWGQILFAVLTLIVLTIALLVYIDSDIFRQQTKPAYASQQAVPEKIKVSIPLNVSFSEYLNITNKTYSHKISLIGFLLENTTRTGSVMRYISDDYGNSIRLILVNRNSKAQEDLFVRNGITPNLYAITGTLKNSIVDGLRIEVVTITPTERPYVLVDG